MPLEFQPALATATPNISVGKRLSLPRRTKVSARERMSFTEQLALLLETGMPLHVALQALQRQAENPAMRRIIAGLISDVEAGQRFSHALGQYPELFSTTYVNLVAASEGGGFMHEVLEQLLAEEQRREQLRATLMSALSYPLFLSGFSVLVVIFVLVVVFPKFGEMFARIADQLPATTIALMWASDVLRLYWWQITAAMAAILFLAYRWLQTPVGSATVDHLKLQVPVLRDIFIQLYLIQCLRVMSLALGRGVSITDTLESCKDVVENTRFRKLLKEVEQTVHDGGLLSAAFNKSSIVPDLVKQMITTAETSGTLAMVMGRIAAHYERELKRKLESLGKMAEPIMLMVMGVVVGIIVSSLILPIFKLSTAVG